MLFAEHVIKHFPMHNSISLFRTNETIHKTCLGFCLGHSRCSVNIILFLIYHLTISAVTISACHWAVAFHYSLQGKLGQYCSLPFLLTNRIQQNPFTMNLQKCRVTVFVNHFNGKNYFSAQHKHSLRL